jgi:spore germination protein YaaH
MSIHALARAIALLLVAVIAACGGDPLVTTGPTASGSASSHDPGTPTAPPPPAVVPAPGHELYGYLPYWEMDDPDIADHLARTPLTTLALFSVTHTGKGTLNTAQKGYSLIIGDVGRRLIDEAHARGTRVDLVYTSFGAARNRKLLDRPERQAAVISELVTLVGQLGLDGINVDIEALDASLIPAYSEFLVAIRAAVVAADPGDQVSVATGAHTVGAAMALAAATAGADRIFLMGYDYRTGRSQPGATSPLDRSDGEQPSLRTSLDLYAALGVPPERLLLGLPLYGVEWPVAGPVVGAPTTGRGQSWLPRNHVDLLTDPAAVPVRDPIEQVEVYLLGSDGSVGAPSIEPGASADTRTWKAVYMDSPATLATKLALANERGLAGAGWWAIGYERGLPGYTDLMVRFAKGEALP